MTVRWHIITGEYPFELGGVADYSRMVARGLAQAGDKVCVWAPAAAVADPNDLRVDVRRLPGNFGPRALISLSRSLVDEPDSHVLVQYVPHAFGFKAMNLFLCVWLFAQRRFDYSIMFHEVAYPIRRGQPLKHNVLGIVQRRMAAIVARRASRVFVSIPNSILLLENLVPGKTIEWLPVPSSIPVVDDPGGVTSLRHRYSPDNLPLVGHFGTYGVLVAPLLDALLPRILNGHDCRALLIGANSIEILARWSKQHPACVDRISATGECEPDALSRAIGACDLMLQPYPDGVSSRRTTVMAALAHSRPVAATRGITTEALWGEHGAVALAPVDDLDGMCANVSRMLADEGLRHKYALAGHELYVQRFDISHTIAAVRGHLPTTGRIGTTRSHQTGAQLSMNRP